MGVTIFLLVMTLLSTFIGGFLLALYNEAEDKGEQKAIFLIILIVTVIFYTMLAFLLESNRIYYEGKEYSLTEFNINKKTIGVEGNDSTKTDTLYFFVKKTNN